MIPQYVRGRMVYSVNHAFFIACLSVTDRLRPISQQFANKLSNTITFLVVCNDLCIIK
jgi:hypothetical protein